MLAHAELMKMQMEKYLAVAKEVNIVLEMADTLFGSAIQMFRHKRLYEEMAGNSTELEKQTDKTIEERLIAIERQLSGSPRLVRGVKP